MSQLKAQTPSVGSKKTTDDYFKGKRVVLFSLPGAFTPTCSTYQLPNYEKLFGEFQEQGIDAIYCLSVNDAFVMNKWGKDQGVENVGLIPDGSGEFTRKMGMLVKKRQSRLWLPLMALCGHHRRWRNRGLVP